MGCISGCWNPVLLLAVLIAPCCQQLGEQMPSPLTFRVEIEEDQPGAMLLHVHGIGWAEAGLFGTAHHFWLSSVSEAVGPDGDQAIAFFIVDDQVDEFDAFTQGMDGLRMVLEIEEDTLMSPFVMRLLPGGGLITGRIDDLEESAIPRFLEIMQSAVR